VDYVEREMQKRKGLTSAEKPAARDQLADLYTLPEHLRVRAHMHHMGVQALAPSPT
jgi:hypothetical protein